MVMATIPPHGNAAFESDSHRFSTVRSADRILVMAPPVRGADQPLVLIAGVTPPLARSDLHGLHTVG